MTRLVSFFRAKAQKSAKEDRQAVVFLSLRSSFAPVAAWREIPPESVSRFNTMLAKERGRLIFRPRRFSARPANPVQPVKNCCKIYRAETVTEDYLNFHSLRLH